MEKIIISGGKELHGHVKISGAKNAAVAIIPAVILSDGVCRIENVPDIQDVNLIARILFEMGASVRRIDKSTLEIDPKGIREPVATYDLVRHMRASSYLMGALLGKFNRAEVALPGGCDFGVRPVDQHLKGFTVLGAPGLALSVWALVCMRRVGKGSPLDAFGHELTPRTRVLLTEGPYKLCRNPMLLGVFLYDFALLIWFRSLAADLVFVVFFLVMMKQVESEEKRLERDFGEEYRAYKARTDKLIPFVW